LGLQALLAHKAQLGLELLEKWVQLAQLELLVLLESLELQVTLVRQEQLGYKAQLGFKEPRAR
jgi:hypothetical protein